MAGRGGARPGAGRKPLAEQYARPIARANKLIADRLPDLVGKMLELAAGVVVQEVDKDGVETVYTQPPNRQACQYLLDRVMGRPTQPQELAGPQGGGIPLDDRIIDDILGRIGGTVDPTGGGEDAE